MMDGDRQTGGGFNRSKERYVWEAMECVEQWRNLYLNEFKDENENIIRYSREEAALMVNVPKKTLENYYSILRYFGVDYYIFPFLRKAKKLTDLNAVKDEKMGYLRNLVKLNKKKQESCLK